MGPDLVLGRTDAERENDAAWDALEDDKATQRWWNAFQCMWILLGWRVYSDARLALEAVR